MKADARVLFTGEPRYAPETPWGPWSAALATALITILPAFAFMVGLALLVGAGYVADPAAGPSAAEMAGLDTPLGVALAMGTQIASLALVWALAGRAGMRAPVLRLTGDRFTWSVYAIGALALLSATGLAEYLLYQWFRIDIFSDTAWLRDGLNSPLAWASAVIAVILAPLWEELTFRGFFLSALANTRLGFWPAALISNLCWTALHGTYSLPGLVSVFIAGLVLSWLVWRTGSIKPAIVVHALGNAAALAFTLAYAPVPA